MDRAFTALADPVRRAGSSPASAAGPATVNELAEPFEITKQAVSKHIQVLEQAGLVTRTPGRPAPARAPEPEPARGSSPPGSTSTG